MLPTRLNKKGFTLMEMLIVVAIIVILLSIGIPILIGEVAKAKDRTCLANRTIIQRELTYALITEAPGAGPIENYEIMDRVLSKHDEEDLCPLGGDYHFNEFDGQAIVFCTEHMSDWEKGKQWKVGDIMYSGDWVFRCLKAHKSGSRSNTRNPSVKSNKGSWELIGTKSGEVPEYNSTVRFGVGTLCTHNGNYYSRTTYNLTGGQMPYANSSSRYWILEGPVTP